MASEQLPAHPLNPCVGSASHVYREMRAQSDPFSELAQAARAAALLKDRGFRPSPAAPRPARSGKVTGCPSLDLRTAADEAKVMKALDRAGIKDAHVMPQSDNGRRVSVGLFSERDRAEKRAQAVKRLGFATEITERQQAGSVYWVDLDVDATERSVPTEGSARCWISLRNSWCCPSFRRWATPPCPRVPRCAPSRNHRGCAYSCGRADRGSRRLFRTHRLQPARALPPSKPSARFIWLTRKAIAFENLNPLMNWACRWTCRRSKRSSCTAGVADIASSRTRCCARRSRELGFEASWSCCARRVECAA